MGAGRRRRRWRRGEGTTGSRAGSRPARPRAVRRPARAPLGRRRGRCARGDRGAGGAVSGGAVNGETEEPRAGLGPRARGAVRGGGTGEPGALCVGPGALCQGWAGSRCGAWGCSCRVQVAGALCWGWGGGRGAFEPGCAGRRSGPAVSPALCASYPARVWETPGVRMPDPSAMLRARFLGQRLLGHLGQGSWEVWRLELCYSSIREPLAPGMME